MKYASAWDKHKHLGCLGLNCFYCDSAMPKSQTLFMEASGKVYMQDPGYASRGTWKKPQNPNLAKQIYLRKKKQEELKKEKH